MAIREKYSLEFISIWDVDRNRTVYELKATRGHDNEWIGGIEAGWLEWVFEDIQKTVEAEYYISSINQALKANGHYIEDFSISGRVYIYITNTGFNGCGDESDPPDNTSIPLFDAKALFLEWIRFLEYD